MIHTKLTQLAPICRSLFAAMDHGSCVVSNDNSSDTQYKFSPFLILTNSRLMLLLPCEYRFFVKSASKL